MRHDDFMRKVPKVLGDEGVRKFSDTYKHPQNGQTYPCYRFPKREACLMAMSYSYELQAKVFDRMTELETGTAKPQHMIPQTLTEALRLAADLADERDNVKRIIETLGDKGVVTLPQIEEVQNPGAGPKTIGVYHLGKRDSLELVEFINGQRGEGEAELQHKHFLEKVAKVLGEETSAKFLADLPDSYGRPRKGYRFPKREACLMATLGTCLQLCPPDTRTA